MNVLPQVVPLPMGHRHTFFSPSVAVGPAPALLAPLIFLPDVEAVEAMMSLTSSSISILVTASPELRK